MGFGLVSLCPFTEGDEQTTRRRRNDVLLPLESVVNAHPQDYKDKMTIGPTEYTPYDCYFCEKSFSSLSLLKRHEQSKKSFHCDICQRLFKHKRCRDFHVGLHARDKKYYCVYCESGFSRSDKFEIHMKNHDHLRPYQCVISNCIYGASAMKNRNVQISVHQLSGERAFPCVECTDKLPIGKKLRTIDPRSQRSVKLSIPAKSFDLIHKCEVRGYGEERQPDVMYPITETSFLFLQTGSIQPA